MPFDLFDAVQPGNSVSHAFLAFHRENPHVYDALRDLALGLKASGWKRAGMKQLFEKLRWDHAISTNNDGAFRLNNNFTSYYARELMANTPELQGFFEVRDRGAHG